MEPTPESPNRRAARHSVERTGSAQAGLPIPCAQANRTDDPATSAPPSTAAHPGRLLQCGHRMVSDGSAHRSNQIGHDRRGRMTWLGSAERLVIAAATSHPVAAPGHNAIGGITTSYSGLWTGCGCYTVSSNLGISSTPISARTTCSTAQAHDSKELVLLSSAELFPSVGMTVDVLRNLGTAPTTEAYTSRPVGRVPGRHEVPRETRRVGAKAVPVGARGAAREGSPRK